MRTLLVAFVALAFAGCLDAEPTPASDLVLEDVAVELPDNFTVAQEFVGTGVGAELAHPFVVNTTAMFKGHAMWTTPSWHLELQNATGDVIESASGNVEAMMHVELAPGNYTLVAKAHFPVGYDNVELHGLFDRVE